MFQVALWFLPAFLGCEGPEGPAGPAGDPAERVVQRVSFDSADDRDSGKVNDRELTFNKVDAGSDLRFGWQDVFIAFSGGLESPACYCQWELTVDDEPCVDPGPAIHLLGSALTEELVSDSYFGWCSETESGPIEAGEHTLNAWVGESTSSCECQTGLNGATGWLEVEELD